MHSSAPPDPHINRATILVVDDTEINRLLCLKALQADYRILTADSGQAALELARSARPDMILLDIMMPDMDGYETMQAFQSDPVLSNIPVVFLTAMSSGESQIKALKMGAFDFVTKPFQFDILRHRIRRILERERLQQELLMRNQQLHDSLNRQKTLGAALDSAFRATNDSLFIADAQMRVFLTNENSRKLFGDLQGLQLGSFLLLSEDGKTINLLQLCADSTAAEAIFRTPDGQSLPVLITGRAYQTSENETNYLFSIQDIRQRLHLEEANRLHNEHLQDMVLELSKQKSALDQHALVSITDTQGRITYANERFCQVSGYQAEELTGRTHRLLKSGLHAPEHYADLWQTICAGKTWHGELANRKRNGDIYWVNTTIIPWLDAQGRPYQFVAIRTEITDRIKAEEQIALARKREVETGGIIQKRLLFGTPPENLSGMSLACYTEASQEIDGDFYTFTKIGPKSFEILTGDVMGKGVIAAMIGAGIKSAYRQILVDHMLSQRDGKLPSPASIINALHKITTPALIEQDAFVTLSLLRFDRETLTMTWVNAGHTPTLYLAKDSQTVNRLTGNNLPIGVLESEVYEEHTQPIGIGDSILMYSDGISESSNPQGEYYGEEPILAILKNGQQLNASSSILLHSLRSDLHDFCDSPTASDDRTAIVVQIRPLRAQKRGTIKDRKEPECFELPRLLNKLGPLRQRIACLAQDQPEAAVQALTLAAFEAATNIIRHTPEKLRDVPFTAVLKRNEKELTVELVHAGDPFVQTAPPNPDFSGNSEGGFGLFIIANTVDQVHYGRPMPGMASIRMVKKLATDPAE
jgi:phosphoserine phosphatase RsbU/P